MNHDAYVFAAYAIAVLVIGGLAFWIRADMAGRRRELAELESRGVKRRAQEA